MGGFAGFGEKLGKKIKKIDPLRGGDVILEKAGLPTMTGEGDKNIFPSVTQETSEVAKPVFMPTVDDAKVSDARRRRLAQQSRQGGRSSTILTDSSNRLGG